MPQLSQFQLRPLTKSCNLLKFPHSGRIIAWKQPWTLIIHRPDDRYDFRANQFKIRHSHWTMTKPIEPSSEPLMETMEYQAPEATENKRRKRNRSDDDVTCCNVLNSCCEVLNSIGSCIIDILCCVWCIQYITSDEAGDGVCGSCDCSSIDLCCCCCC